MEVCSISLKNESQYSNGSPVNLLLLLVFKVCKILITDTIILNAINI